MGQIIEFYYHHNITYWLYKQIRSKICSRIENHWHEEQMTLIRPVRRNNKGKPMTNNSKRKIPMANVVVIGGGLESL